MNRKITLLILILIFLIGIFFRFYNLKNKGIFFYDEGIYLCSAKAKYQILNKSYDQRNFSSASEGIKNSKARNFAMGSKISYVFFVFLSFLIFGLKEHSSFIVSAFFGVLTIYLLYIIGRKIYSIKVALLSMLLLSVSAMAVMYSRHGLPQAQSVFFLYLSWYLYLKYTIEDKKIINLLLSGIFCGFAVTTHYNLLLFPFVFIFFEIINKGKKKGQLPLSIVIYSISVIIPFLFWQFITLIDKKFKWGLFPVTYFQELKASLFFIGGQINRGIDPFFSLYYFQKMEGWLIFLSFIIGTYFLVKRLKIKFSLPEFTLLIIAYFPIVWFGFYPHLRVLRSFFVALPAMHIISAKFLYDFIVWEKMKKVKYALASLIVMWIVFFGFLSSWPIVNFKSSYRRCVNYLITENKLKLATDQMEMYPVWCYYMGEEVVPLEKFKNISNFASDDVRTLVNIWSYNKELENLSLKPECVFCQISFSSFNAEGGTKDKYKIKDIPEKRIEIYSMEYLRQR